MEITSDEPEFDAEYRRLAKSESPYDARAGSMMLDFVAALQRDVGGPRLFASYFDGELWLQYSAPSGASNLIRVTIDRPDYGPLENGVPRFHYRLSSSLKPSVGSEKSFPDEERAHSVETGCEFVRDAIIRTKRSP